MGRLQFIQPRLDGGALKHFHITADFRWPTGWRSSLWIAQEGDESPQPFCVATSSELDSAQLWEHVRMWLDWLDTID